MYKLFLCLRYLRKRLITFIAILMVMANVAIMLIVVSVMGGFLDMVRERSRSLVGDIVIDSNSIQGIPYYQEFIDTLKTEMPDVVEEGAPVIYTAGLLKLPDPRGPERTTDRLDVTEMVRIVGLRLDAAVRVTGFGDGLYYNKYYPGTTTLAPQTQPFLDIDAMGTFSLPEDLERAFLGYLETEANAAEREKWLPRDEGPAPRPGRWDPPPIDPDAKNLPLPGMIIGVDLIAQRTDDGDYERWMYARGHEVWLTMLPISAIGTFSASGVRHVAGRYIDDSRTGVYDIDSRCVYLDFDTLQDYMDMGPQNSSELLFTLPSETRKTLEREAIDDALRQVFAHHDFKLSPEAKVTADKEVEAWVILDGAYTFIIEQEEDDLNVTGGLKLPARASQIQFKLRDGIDPDQAKTRIVDAWASFFERQRGKPDWRFLTYVDESAIQTWEEKQSTILGAVEKEKALVTIIYGVIAVGAIAMVGCILYMIVQQMTRDIGIIKSVGASAWGVAGIFLGFGGAVGVIGAVTGSAMGYYFVRHINGVQNLLIRLNPGLRVWDPKVYAFDRIPNSVRIDELVMIAIGAVIVSIVGSVVAAWRAGRVWPVEALRYE